MQRAVSRRQTPASSAEDDGDAETRELLRALGEDEEALQLLGGDANDDDDDDALVLEHLELDDDEVALQLCVGDDDDALEHLFDLCMTRRTPPTMMRPVRAPNAAA